MNNNSNIQSAIYDFRYRKTYYRESLGNSNPVSWQLSQVQVELVINTVEPHGRLTFQGAVTPEPTWYQVVRGRGLQLHWSWSTTLLLCSLMSQLVVWTPHPVTHVLHFSKSWRGRGEQLSVPFINHQQGTWIWTVCILNTNNMEFNRVILCWCVILLQMLIKQLCQNLVKCTK